MHSKDNVLVQDVKNEILAELRQGNSPQGSQRIGYTNNPTYISSPPWADPGIHPSTPMYQTIKDSVKDEVLADIEMQRADRVARAYGLDCSLSDRRLQQMIDSRYMTIDNMKSEIKKELQAFQRMEKRRPSDPYIRQVAGVLMEEARIQGIPTEQLIRSLDHKTNAGSGLAGRVMNTLNTGQRKGFLYGVGSAVLFYLLWPSARTNMRSIAVRSIEEGMSVVDRAKTFMDGKSQQPPTQDFTEFASPPPPPQGTPPTGGDNPQQ